MLIDGSSCYFEVKQSDDLWQQLLDYSCADRRDPRRPRTKTRVLAL